MSKEDDSISNNGDAGMSFGGRNAAKKVRISAISIIWRYLPRVKTKSQNNGVPIYAKRLR